MKALLIVDVQNDFCAGGALPAPDGDKIIPTINNLAKQFDVVLASRDDHPAESDHFKKWPVHCVTGSEGAKFHPDLDTSNIK
ncbi:MAG TPA: nicotinamidase, partial [Bacteroidales bacterium]|nr:nicotinamidase [Bacteroidales bacterium]